MPVVRVGYVGFGGLFIMWGYELTITFATSSSGRPHMHTTDRAHFFCCTPLQPPAVAYMRWQPAGTAVGFFMLHGGLRH